MVRKTNELNELSKKYKYKEPLVRKIKVNPKWYEKIKELAEDRKVGYFFESLSCISGVVVLADRNVAPDKMVSLDKDDRLVNVIDIGGF